MAGAENNARRVGDHADGASVRDVAAETTATGADARLPKPAEPNDAETDGARAHHQSSDMGISVVAGAIARACAALMCCRIRSSARSASRSSIADMICE